MLYLQAAVPIRHTPGGVTGTRVVTAPHAHQQANPPCLAVRLAAAALSVSVLMAGCTAHAQTVSGMARAVDGDTLEVAGTRIRLYGMDAPEKAQLCKTKAGQDYPCGQLSMDALKAQVAKGPVRCTVQDKDQYGRTVASCQLPTGDDAGEYMVKNGLAVAYRQYSSQYIKAEEDARSARRGIWQGSFEVPSEWRKRTKAQEALGISPVMASVPPPAPATRPTTSVPTTSVPPPTKGCDIKGNISSSGERIFHVPGGQYYESVRIEEDKGERWFCSEADAEKAGWRKSLR